MPEGTFEGLFTLRTDSYSLCSEQEFIIPKVNTLFKGKNSFRYFDAIIWNSTPSDIITDKNNELHNKFHSKIKCRVLMQIMLRLCTKLRIR